MSQAVEKLYDRARAGLAQGDAGYWAAAEAMAALSEAGESQRTIGAKLGCSAMTVSNYVRVWAVNARLQPRPSFSEALGQIRDYKQEWADRKDPMPKTPERRAELAADLLKDKAVADAPAVRKVISRHVDRRIRQEAAEWNRAQNIPTRTEAERDRRRLSPVVNKSFWRDFLWAMSKANQMMVEACSELDRTGLPEQSAEIIKAARQVARNAQRVEEAASMLAIGEPFDHIG